MRQITFFKFECGISEMVQAADGRFDLVRRPICEVEATSLTKADIRKAIIDAGEECPRGTDVYADKIGKVVYRFETEDLLRICKEREEIPFEA